MSNATLTCVCGETVHLIGDPLGVSCTGCGRIWQRHEGAAGRYYTEKGLHREADRIAEVIALPSVAAAPKRRRKEDEVNE